jgi:ribosomal protein L40E
MTALTATAIRAVRARFGDDADAVMALRAAHKTVRPFGDQFAVDEVVVDADELERMAARLRPAKAKRAKQKPAPETSARGSAAGTETMKGSAMTGRPGSAAATLSDAALGACVDDVPRPGSPQSDGTPVSSDAPVPNARVGAGPVLCPCGRPTSHYGRCWHRRGMSAPTAKSASRRPLPRVCEKCGGPRSYWSAGQCRKCYEANRVKPQTQAAQIAALRDEIAAVRAEQAAFEAKVKAAVVEMLERFDGGESR